MQQRACYVQVLKTGTSVVKTMFRLPIDAIERMRPARALTWAAASDSSLLLILSNGKTVQLDGFW